MFKLQELNAQQLTNTIREMNYVQEPNIVEKSSSECKCNSILLLEFSKIYSNFVYFKAIVHTKTKI